MRQRGGMEGERDNLTADGDGSTGVSSITSRISVRS